MKNIFLNSLFTFCLWVVLLDNSYASSNFDLINENMINEENKSIILVENNVVENNVVENSNEEIIEEVNLETGFYDLSETIERILPSVVGIQALTNNSYQYNDTEEESSSSFLSLGSGFLISPDGYILTNNHIINGAKKINIKLKGSDVNFPAEVVGVDKIMDIALLKISLKNELPYVEFDQTQSYKIGDPVIIAGNPYNLGLSISKGIISALNRNLNLSSFDNFIQTDALINKGNSGGPMFNISGKVIGLTSAIYSLNGENSGIGFAIPTYDLLPLIEELKRYGYIRRGYIGVVAKNTQNEIYRTLNSPIRRGGVVITNIEKDSPAEDANLLISDIILKYNGKNVRNIRELFLFIANTEIGSDVNLQILRNNQIINKKIEITENKQTYEYDSQYEKILSDAVEIFDMVLIPVNKQSKELFNISENNGMYILNLRNNGLADRKGMEVGDAILTINQDQLKNKDTILKNMHYAELNNLDYIFLITNADKDNLIFIPLDEFKTLKTRSL